MDNMRQVVEVELEDTGKDACEFNIRMNCGHWNMKEWLETPPSVGDMWPCVVCWDGE